MHLKTLLIILGFAVSLNAQYQPLVTEGSSWAYKITFYDGPSGITFHYRVDIESDTMHNEIKYNKVFGNKNNNESQLIGLIREEDKVVRYLPLESDFLYAAHSPCTTYQEEFILYDFNLKLGDSIAFCDDYFSALSTDAVDISGFELPTWKIKYPGDDFNESIEDVVAGVGSVSDGFFGPSLGVFENTNFFQCVSNGDVQHVASDQNNYVVNTDCQRIVSSKDVIIDHDVFILPNPVSSVLKIESKVTFSEYKLFTANGDKIDSGVVNDALIRVEELRSGSYFLQLFSGGKYVVKHFVKL